VSRLFIDSHKLKHEATKNSLLIFYTFNTFPMTQQISIMYLLTRKYTFINIVKRQRFFAQFF